MLTAAFLVWITVMNPDGIATANGYHAYGTACSLSPPITAVLVGTKDEQRVYSLTLDSKAYGARCPHGTLFAMRPDEFQRLTVPPDASDR